MSCNSDSAVISGFLEVSQQALLSHPVYTGVNSRNALSTFMREHVFAVWDFMTLLKRLQREFCGTPLPWVPPSDSRRARFINEIVLAEESDDDGRGGSISHFELYLEAMKEVGADSGPVRSLVAAVHENPQLSRVPESIELLPQTREFVNKTLSLARSGEVIAVAAAFCYGREDIIPQMFSRLLTSFEQQGSSCPRFRYYLQRHVELDGDEHGPYARSLVAGLCGDDPGLLEMACTAARDAIAQRIRLWDGILQAIRDEDAA